MNGAPRSSVVRVDRGALTVLHSEIQERKDAELAVDSPALGHTQTDHGRRVGGVCRRAEIIVAVVCPALAAVASRQTRGVRPGDCDALPLSWPNIAKLISSSLSCNQGVASNPYKTREHHPTTPPYSMQPLMNLGSSPISGSPNVL